MPIIIIKMMNEDVDDYPDDTNLAVRENSNSRVVATWKLLFPRLEIGRRDRIWMIMILKMIMRTEEGRTYR